MDIISSGLPRNRFLLGYLFKVLQIACRAHLEQSFHLLTIVYNTMCVINITVLITIMCLPITIPIVESLVQIHDSSH